MIDDPSTGAGAGSDDDAAPATSTQPGGLAPGVAERMGVELAATAHSELVDLAEHWAERQGEFDPNSGGGVSGEQRSLLRDAGRRFGHNRAAMLSLVGLLVYVLLAVLVPAFNGEEGRRAGSRELTFQIADKYAEPGGWKEFVSVRHPLGYDRSGRDMFTKVWIGGRISLAIGFSVALVILVVGILYGSISGYAGGRLDAALMRLLDALYGIPYLPFAIILVAVIKGRLDSPNPMLYLVPALTVTSWFTAARIMRGQMLTLKQNEYVESALSSGASGARIIRRHLLPNTLGVMVVAIFLEIPNAILGEATLSVLGLGVPFGEPSWGSLVNEGFRAVVDGHPTGDQLIYIWAPGFLIATTVLFAVSIADGLRDALDPRGKTN